MAFVKLDCGIIDSSLWCCEDSDTRIVWVTMIAMADSLGVVRAKAPGISARARVSLEATRKALAKFQEPDKESRTEAHEGRRIEKAPGGYVILNYESNRQKDHSAAARMRLKRSRDADGITKLIQQQSGRCDCCNQPFETPYSNHVVQDRCPKTKRPRGLLCHSCQSLVGGVELGEPSTGPTKTLADTYFKKWGDLLRGDRPVESGDRVGLGLMLLRSMGLRHHRYDGPLASCGSAVVLAAWASRASAAKDPKRPGGLLAKLLVEDGPSSVPGLTAKAVCEAVKVGVVTGIRPSDGVAWIELAGAKQNRDGLHVAGVVIPTGDLMVHEYRPVFTINARGATGLTHVSLTVKDKHRARAMLTTTNRPGDDA